MEFKPLGGTSVLVSEIGMGTWRYRGDRKVLERSLELGGSLIDTAEAYGTETAVGKAVHGRRGDYFLATKVSPEHLGYRDVLRAADESLKKLGTDSIDLYQVHWPNPSIPIEDTMRAMAELVSAGKVRAVGVSNFSVEQLKDAQAALGDVPVVSNQVRYSIFRREIEKDLLPHCQAGNVTVIAYSPLAQGKLDHELGRRLGLVQAVDQVCQAMGKTRAQVILAWCVHLPMVIAIPQTNRVERVDENCGASGWRLTSDQYAALASAAG